MPKSFKELHSEKQELERKESLAVMRGTLDLVKICAENATSWAEFVKHLKGAIEQIDGKIGE